jgi:hypothetical protein
MTLLDERLDPAAGEPEVLVGDVEPDSTPVTIETDDETLASPLATAGAAFLAVAAAGWMVAGVFDGSFARVLAVLGALIGVGTTAVSYRAKVVATVQYLVLPIAVVVGAVFALAAAKGASLPTVIVEAVRGGGIAQPPMPFDPGWRFIVIILMAVMGAAAASLAIGLNRPKLGIVVPAPLLFGAALLQPPGRTITSSVIALVLFVASFAVSFGVDLGQQGATSGSFEVRRIGRGFGLIAILIAVVIGLSQLGFLFPAPNDDQVIPPKRPETPPAAPDRVLFTVKLTRQVPLRLGVLDVYRDNAWMTPPYSTGRLKKIPPAGTIAAGTRLGELPAVAPQPAGAGPKLHAQFTIADIGGHVVPDVANPLSVRHGNVDLRYDPRTQSLRLPASRAASGLTYDVTTNPLPTAKQLSGAGPVPPGMKEYLDVPAPPRQVAELLATAPKTNAFDRLQYLRNAYYQKVVAAGPGKPVDVSPARVGAMLDGKAASPFEITAGEALLARWAGVPARVGYGYYGGDRAGSSLVWSVRPHHGSTWLEVYFDGYGWVPIVGTPPRAQSSLRPSDKNKDPAVRPTEELALLVYVPIRQSTFQQLYIVVRYWAARGLPLAAGLLLLWGFYPGAVKVARRARRRRWAVEQGLPARIAVAYAELRDVANDLNLGHPAMTPLEFLAVVAPDPEHQQLSWLVTRSLWGDLRRDLRAEDAEAAEEMSTSVLRRVRRANPAINRLVAVGSRVSLRDPYSDELPNLWPRRDPHRTLRRRLGDGVDFLRRRGLRPAPAAIVLLLALLLTSCGGPAAAVPAAAGLPARVAPAALGDITMVREAAAEANYRKPGDVSLVSEGRVFSMHQGDVIQGSLQVAAFKRGYSATRHDVRDGVLQSIASGHFALTRLGQDRVYTLTLPEQRIYVWYPASGRYYVLMVARRAYAEADSLFASVLAYQRGEGTTPTVVQVPLDPRRGGGQ